LIKSVVSQRIPLDVSDSDTVSEIKKRVSALMSERGIFIPRTQHLSYKGHVISDDKCLSSVGCTEGDYLMFLYDLKAMPDQISEPTIQPMQIDTPAFAVDELVADIVSSLRQNSQQQQQISNMQQQVIQTDSYRSQQAQSRQNQVSTQPQAQAQVQPQPQPQAQAQAHSQLQQPLHIPGEEVIVSMGFTSRQARRALLLNNLDAELALDWLLEHSNDPEDAPLSASEARQILETVQSLETRAEESMATKVEKCIKDKKCTFVATGRNYAAQDWYHCYSCGLVDSEGVCESCAVVCHKGHKLSEKKKAGSFFCDCGAGAYNCKCNT